jgi:dihydroneopterin aldolase/2-amino-4-hydroxy-6-hydroxymethyldihydropteridine diphosphokinase/dihydropteroate synthase
MHADVRPYSIVPGFRHPVLKKTISNLLSQIPEQSFVRRILNFPATTKTSNTGSSSTPIVWPLGQQTHIMATLNTTPDSFSDGGAYNSRDTVVEYVTHSLRSGAGIIDIGGYSTRPGSSFVSVNEEIDRTVPFIKVLREEGVDVPISIDTFRAEVAESCLDAGANCINDVYGLAGPHEGVAGVALSDIVPDELGVPVSDGGAMLDVAARAKVPVIIMHSRGIANKNKDYSALKGGVLEGVRAELGLRVHRALKAGVRRWNIVLDPGIGFSKTVEDNVRLVRHHAQLTKQTASNSETDILPSTPRLDLDNFPTLIGTSRKSYLGELTGREETRKDGKARDWATAAAVTSAIHQRADIVRVHDVKMAQDVVKVADAIWRTM